jgi:hypothetical protein
MGEIRKDAIGSLNAFLKDQKEVPGDARVTAIIFNDEYHVLYDGIPIADVADFDDKNYAPMGTTALLDAIGKAIDATGQRLSLLGEEDRPEKVLVAILTDGLENSSREYNRSQIYDKIKHQRDLYQWEFAFLAANQDAFAEGTKLGIDAKMTMFFAATPDGVQKGISSLSSKTRSFRMAK